MNTTSALFNLMPDSGSVSAVGKRLNAARAVAVTSGSPSPSSPFDALLKQAEAQAPAPSDSAAAALKRSDHEADHVEGRLNDEEVDSEDAVRRTLEDMTTPPTTDAWIPQGWSPREDLTHAFAGGNLSWSEPKMPDVGTNGSPQEHHSLRASDAEGGTTAAAAATTRGIGSEPPRPMDPVRSSTRFMEAGALVGPTPTKADPRGARESDSIRALALGTTRVEGGLEGASIVPNDEVRAGLTLDHDTTGGESTPSSDTEVGPLAGQRFSESVTAPVPSTGFEPAAPNKPDVAGGRPSPLGSASAEAIGMSSSRAPAPSVLATQAATASPAPRATSAVDSRKARAGEAPSTEAESLKAPQEGSYSAEEQRSSFKRVAAATSTSVSAQPAPLSQPPNIAQPTALPLPAGSMNFSQVMEHARTAPDGYTAARVDTPLTDEAFPRVLGLQIGRWTDEGVQQVWLDVHPADMGPVAIQIALDGRQAELNFGAESAAARQVIEASLPELASALQAAGLTLSGGSISQDMPQSRPRPESAVESDGRRGTGSGGAGAEPQTLAPARAARARGLVDLYA